MVGKVSSYFSGWKNMQFAITKTSCCSALVGTMEIGTLEELIEWVEQQKSANGTQMEVIIKLDTDHGIPELEIYDGYRE